MSAIPVPRTWVAGEVVTAALMNTEIRDVHNWLLSGFPLWRSKQTATQSIANDSWTNITFTTEIVDRSNGHSTSVNTSRYTVPSGEAGIYEARGVVVFNNSSAGTGRDARWAVNGTPVAGSVIIAQQVSGNVTSILTEVTEALAVGDYLQLQGYHAIGSTLDTFINSDTSSSAAVKFISS